MIAKWVSFFSVALLVSSVAVAQTEMNKATGLLNSFESKKRKIEKQAADAIKEEKKVTIEALTAIKEDLTARKLPVLASKIQALIDRCESGPSKKESNFAKTEANGITLTSPSHSLELNRYSDTNFAIECTLRSENADVVQFVEVYVRRLRVGRPLPDFQWEGKIEVKGGVKPGEFLRWGFSLPSGQLNSEDSPVLQAGETMEVSLDGKTWIAASRNQAPDPFLQQLMRAGEPRR